MTVLRDARSDPGVRVVVLRGAGDRAFCAGADLGGMRGDAGYAAMHDARGQLAGVFEDLWTLGKPTIARVQGYCLAGGFGLALSCDLVVAADDAVFGTPEIDVGLVAVHDHGPAVSLDAAQTSTRADDDRPSRERPRRANGSGS